MTNERQAPREWWIAKAKINDFIYETFQEADSIPLDLDWFHVVEYSAYNALEQQLQRYEHETETVKEMKSALEAMTKHCENAEENYHFYHREWELACERWNYSQEQLAEVTKERDKYKRLAEIQSKIELEWRDKTSTLTIERDELKAQLHEINDSHRYRALAKERDELKKQVSDSRLYAQRLADKLERLRPRMIWTERDWRQDCENAEEQNQFLTKDRDAWKLMAEKTAGSIQNADHECRTYLQTEVLAEFAEMVKEKE